MRYGKEDMRAIPDKLSDGGMLKNRQIIHSKQLENLTEKSGSYSNNDRSVKSKSQTRKLDNYQIMMLENTSSDVSKHSKNQKTLRPCI